MVILRALFTMAALCDVTRITKANGNKNAFGENPSCTYGARSDLFIYDPLVCFSLRQSLFRCVFAILKRRLCTNIQVAYT